MSTNSLANRSLKDRVQARLTHLDLGTYDLDWLNSRKVSEIQSQLQWLDDAAAECRVDGDLDSAEAYEEVLEVIQIESQLARAQFDLIYPVTTPLVFGITGSTKG